jgi:hypothetical protein
MIEIKRLAAVYPAFLGPKIILPEFALGVVAPIALGILTVRRSQSFSGTVFGLYLVTLGINYVPLLLNAIGIARRGSARAEIADETGDQQRLLQRYRRQSALLLLPGIVPVVAILQELRRTRIR